MDSSIRFFSENISFVPRNKRILRRWIEEVISDLNRKAGGINFILCDDDFLLEINRQYLKHDFLTDIITFPFSDDGVILSGDIYISFDRIKENSGIFGVNTDEELHRVMIHGILHLAGFKD